MKRTIAFIAVIALCQTLAFGQKKYEMVIEKTDGSEIAVNVEDIVRTYFRERTDGSGGAYSTCPNGNHPHWIDLGLPSGTLWRCCNEGASTPEDYGDYYTFGQVPTAPTKEQMKELINNCSYSWTTQEGVNGGKFTGPNGGAIFLPAAGVRWANGEFRGVGTHGVYWSSTPDGSYYGITMVYNSSGYASTSSNSRTVRQPVRSVR